MVSDNEQKEINQKNLNFSMFEKNDSNMPIIYSTQNTLLRDALISLKVYKLKILQL